MPPTMPTPSPLSPSPQLRFVTVCPFCGTPLEVVEVPPGETWGPAALWGYLAQQQHNRRCQPPLSRQLTRTENAT